MSLQSQLSSFSMTFNKNGCFILSSNSQSSFALNDFEEQPKFPAGGVRSHNGIDETSTLQHYWDNNNNISYNTGIVVNNNNTMLASDSCGNNVMNYNNHMFVNNNYGSNMMNMNFSGGFHQFSGKIESSTHIVGNPLYVPVNNKNNKQCYDILRDSEAEEEFQEANNEASIGSVGTTVQETADTGAETNDEPTDEPLAYLQGLNSGNLMQFSQVWASSGAATNRLALK